MTRDRRRDLIDDPVWREVVRQTMHDAKVDASIDYKNLSDELMAQFGTLQTPVNLRNKFSRGNFGVQLLMQILCIVGHSNLSPAKIMARYHEAKSKYDSASKQSR